MRRDREQMVITGLGIFTAAGRNKQEVVQAMSENRSGIGSMTRFDTSWADCHIGAEIKGYNPGDYFTPEDQARYDLCTQYAIQAGLEALADSGLDLGRVASRFGAVLGTCNGGLVSLEGARSLQELTHEDAMRYLFYYQSEAMAAHFGLRGPVTTIVTACAASGNAIGFACDLIRSGQADYMLAGGSDAMAMSVYAGFNTLQALNQRVCSPYSEAYGLSLGEGAAMVVIEPMSRALARGAHIYAEIRSYGLSSDAYHITAPEPEGAGIQRAVDFVFRSGHTAPEAIEYINTHGTGTQANDAAELRGLRTALGPHFDRVAVSSSKPYFGHCLGAAAAVELASSLALMDQGQIPATLHFEKPRPGCEDVRLIANELQPAEVTWFCSTNAAFGGNNSALLLQRNPRPEELPAPAGHRVVITGLGYATSFGHGNDDLSERVHQLEVFDLTPAEFSLKEYNKDLYERRMNALTQMSIAAADLALRDAGLVVEAENAADIGVLFGSSRGSLASAEKYLQPIFDNGGRAASSIYFPDLVLNSTAGRVAMKLKLKGYNSTLANGGTCGLVSTFYGSELIRNGCQTWCLVGAGDETSGLSDALNRALSWPESTTEGSTFMLLETLESAAQRGARMYAEVLGFGSSSSGDTQAPDAGAGAGAIVTALQSAGLAPEEIGHVYLAAALPEGEGILAEAASQVVPDSEPVWLPQTLRFGHSVSSQYAVALAVSEMAGVSSRVLAGKGHRLEKGERPALVVAMTAFGSYAALVVGPAPH